MCAFSKMGHSSAVWDCKAAVEITKDLNGVGQVVLRNPQGASAQVRIYFSPILNWFFKAWDTDYRISLNC